MSYYDGAVFVVPQDGKDAAIRFWKDAWAQARDGGARRCVASWGEDVPHGKRTDFWRAVQARDGENVAFCWYEWPDRATADAFWQGVRDEAEAGGSPLPPMPFDGQRSIFGGFSPIMAEGDDRDSQWFWGFLLPIPTANRDRYVAAARQGWDIFRSLGANASTECLAEDVPRGKVTDMWRAVEATDDETVGYSWVGWPDRATADAGQKRMMEDPAMHDMDMPFDGARMFWGGFAKIVDERA